MNLISTLIITIFWVFESISLPLGYYSGDRLNVETIDTLVAQVTPGTVLILGEKHYQPAAQRSQMEILGALRRKGFSVSVGMEFISYPNQAILDLYRIGKLTEAEFLSQAEWGGSPFDGYRELALFARPSMGEHTIAINAPRQITSKIAKSGLSSLNSEESLLLPPNFEVGRASYKKRFFEIMGSHVAAGPILDNYFVAHSVWDDTMAWQTAQFLEKNPAQVFVIIVGEFHSQYGGGLPDRLRARGVKSILTLSQVDHTDYSDEELEKEIIPHPEYGPRADYLWIF